MSGRGDFSPLGASVIKPTYEDEDMLIAGMVYMYTEGNYSCDCNKRLFIARAYQEDEPDDSECTDKIELVKLTLIRPDLTELVIFEDN